MAAPFRSGDVVAIRERWRGRLWSAVPHRWVGTYGGQYVTFVPEGTAATYASNRDLPETADMPREQRKLRALETGVYRVVERRIDRSMLHFFTPGSWARVNLGWLPRRTFTGWYVNFEKPLTLDSKGLETMDLLLDLLIGPDGSARWKDRDSFDSAVERGLHPGDLLSTLEAAGRTMLAQHLRAQGPFHPMWRAWQPEPAWSMPELPEEYRVGGSAWDGPRG